MFAARDAHGCVRFVADVARGAYIAIGNEHVADRPSEGAALLHVQCPLPELNTLTDVHVIRTEKDARAFVRKHMILRWGFLPDFLGLYGRKFDVPWFHAAAHSSAPEG